MSSPSLTGSLAKRATAGDDGGRDAPGQVITLPAVVAASPQPPVAASGAPYNDDTPAADPVVTEVVDFARSGVISRILTPSSSRHVSTGPPRGGSCDDSTSRSKLHHNNNSSFLHPNHSIGSHSSRRRHDTASPASVSVSGRSYRHNPYLASAAASQHSAVPAQGSLDTASFGDHEGSTHELNLSRGSHSGSCHAAGLAYNGRSLSESNSRSSRTMAGSPARAGSLRYLPGQAGIHDTVSILVPGSPHRRTAADSFSGEVSFGARSTASSVDRSLRSSPGAAPFTTLFAPASHAQRSDGLTPSTAAPQHLDAPYVREQSPQQGSGIHSSGGGGGGVASPDSSALYQSFGSSNVTHSMNSNNPYVGVRMTPETTSLLQPQTLVHVRAMDSGSSETRAHPLAPEYDAAALMERPRSAQPMQVQTSSIAYEDPSEASFREAQQQWSAVTQPIRVAPVYSRVSRQSSQRTTPPASTLRSASTGGATTASSPYMNNLSPTERYTPTNRPPLTGSPPTSIQPDTREYTDYEVSPTASQQTNVLSPPSFLASPLAGWTSADSPSQTPSTAAGGSAPAGHVPQQQLALLLPPSFATASASSPPNGTNSLVRGGVSPHSPLTHGTSGGAAVSPVPMAEMERVGEGYQSGTQTGSPVDGATHDEHEQAPHNGGGLGATLPLSGSPPLARFAQHKALLSTPSPTHADPAMATSTTALDGASMTSTDVLSDTPTGTTYPNQLATHAAKVGSNAVRGSPRSCGDFSSANGITAEINRSAPSLDQVALQHQSQQQQAATAADSQVLVLKDHDDEADNEDENEDGDDEEGTVAASQHGAGGKRKKKRARRTRKVKVLEDLPPVTSMKYLPPPPPPPPSSQQLNPKSTEFQRFLALLGRWYVRVLADEADFVDVSRAAAFDAAAAAPFLTAAAQQTRDGQYTPYVWSAVSPVAWSPLSSPPSGPISPPFRPLTSPLGGGGGSNVGGGAAPEVHVRCPRVEQYVAPDDIPAALRLGAVDEIAAAAAAAKSPIVKDVSGLLRLAQDLETWWFCYVFPFVAHPRHQPPPTGPNMAASLPQQYQQLQYQVPQQQLQYQVPQQQLQYEAPQQHQVAQPYTQHISPYMQQQQQQQIYGQQHQQVYGQQQPYMQQVAAANLNASYTSAGSAGYEYPYGWSPSTTAAVPQSMMMGRVPGVYSPTNQQPQPVMSMDGSYTTMTSPLQSPVYGHLPMQQAMAQQPPPMPRGYLMSMYSTY